MSNLRAFDVEVTQHVKVTLDADAFDEAFMEEFRDGFFPFTTLQDHAEHIAQLHARGIVESGDFIEGYGEPDEMGIAVEVEFTDTAALSASPSTNKGGEG